MEIEKTTHYNQKRKRKAEFIHPPNMLKAKVGSGGLSDDILEKAQKLLEENSSEFVPLADIYLARLMTGIKQATGYSPDGPTKSEEIIATMIYPAMQLKANGGMFKYDLVTTISDKLVQYLEVIQEPDMDAVEIIIAFHTTIKAVVHGKITGDGGAHGLELTDALDNACIRYFDKNPKPREKKYTDYTELF